MFTVDYRLLILRYPPPRFPLEEAFQTTSVVHLGKMPLSRITSTTLRPTMLHLSSTGREGHTLMLRLTGKHHSPLPPET
jgi:hypothetical protein